jgi:pimeloyl-ACP methyl ester carboxylesterase
VTLDVPVAVAWRAFCDVRGWPRWNPCFRWATVVGGELRRGALLVWVFGPIRWWFPYVLPAVARVVEHEHERRVTWEVRALPGFRARHSYRFEPLGEDRCRFGSWEVADGPAYRGLRRFWLAHFRYVCRTSLAGATALGSAATRAGVRLVDHGAGTARPPLVVIPGIDGSWGSVAPFVEDLAGDRRVVVADYTREDNPNLDDLAAEIAGAVAAHVDGPVDVLGQSIGSVLAARVARDPRVAARRVVLVGTFTRARWRALRVATVAMALSTRALNRLTAPPLMALVCGPVGDGRGHPFFATSAESDPSGVRRRTAWQVDRDFGPDIRAVDAPLLVLLGDRDRFVPDAAAQLAELRALLDGRDARVVPVRGGGHVLLPSAAVGAALAEIRAFLG